MKVSRDSNETKSKANGCHAYGRDQSFNNHQNSCTNERLEGVCCCVVWCDGCIKGTTTWTETKDGGQVGFTIGATALDDENVA